jgi:hypothetical protein
VNKFSKIIGGYDIHFRLAFHGQRDFRLHTHILSCGIGGVTLHPIDFSIWLPKTCLDVLIEEILRGRFIDLIEDIAHLTDFSHFLNWDLDWHRTLLLDLGEASIGATHDLINIMSKQINLIGIY